MANYKDRKVHPRTPVRTTDEYEQYVGKAPLTGVLLATFTTPALKQPMMRILVDGRKNPETFHASFWEPIPNEPQSQTTTSANAVQESGAQVDPNLDADRQSGQVPHSGTVQ